MFSSLKARILEFRNNFDLDALTLQMVREAKQNGLTISKANMKEFIIKTMTD